MGQTFPAFPDLPDNTITITLDGVDFRIRSRWYERLGAWYVDLYDASDNAIALGYRVASGSGLWSGLPVDGMHTGVLFVRGSGTERDDYGDSLSLYFVPAADLVALDDLEPDDELVVTIALG